MKNVIVYLIGFPGTGKYTIAKVISGLIGAKLVDNHLINNPVFSVIHKDGITPFPESIWEKTREIRRIVLETIAEISPPDYNFIFTNHLVQGDLTDAKSFLDIEDLASKRQSKLITVRLLCKEDELCRRIVSAERKERLKSINPEFARHNVRTNEILKINSFNNLDLDVTLLTPLQAAETIVEFINTIEKPTHPH